MTKRTMTRSEYEYKQAELQGVYNEIERLSSTKAVLAQDGTDDENPAFGYNNHMLEAAYIKREQLTQELNGVTIIDPEKGEEGSFSEYAKSITLKCVFEEDDVEEETLNVGRTGNCISPASPLFKFLFGKKVGFKDTFRHTTDRNGTIVYEVEIIDIEF